MPSCLKDLKEASELRLREAWKRVDFLQSELVVAEATIRRRESEAIEEERLKREARRDAFAQTIADESEMTTLLGRLRFAVGGEGTPDPTDWLLQRLARAEESLRELQAGSATNMVQMDHSLTQNSTKESQTCILNAQMRFRCLTLSGPH